MPQGTKKIYLELTLLEAWTVNEQLHIASPEFSSRYEQQQHSDHIRWVSARLNRLIRQATDPAAAQIPNSCCSDLLEAAKNISELLDAQRGKFLTAAGRNGLKVSIASLNAAIAKAEGR